MTTQPAGLASPLPLGWARQGSDSKPQSGTADRPLSVKVPTAKEKGQRFQKPFENPSPFACDLDHQDAPFNDVQMLVRDP